MRALLVLFTLYTFRALAQETTTKETENPLRNAIKKSCTMTFAASDYDKTCELDFGLPGKTTIVTSINVYCMGTGDSTMQFWGPRAADWFDWIVQGTFSPAQVQGTSVEQSVTYTGLRTPAPATAPNVAPRLYFTVSRTTARSTFNGTAAQCGVRISGYTLP